ncbi:hypothetical protein V5799_006907 [Amblyomma americanum]|uniref:Ionotropic glutamate receptor L-glutamate and glycine-binding domain-containing protein n=1 Tax=Amblyomma americanum TaxID=6943 RepID=A0AAQ4DV29_AMBAM
MPASQLANFRRLDGGELFLSTKKILMKHSGYWVRDGEHNHKVSPLRPMCQGTLLFPPYLDVIQQDGHIVLTGVVGNVLMLIIEALKLQATFTLPPDGTYGVRLPDGNWTGKMGMLIRNEADLSPGPLAITSSRVKVANPSFPWAYENMIIFAARPLRFTTNVFGFVSAFSEAVWLAIAATLLSLALLLACIVPKTAIGGNHRAAARRSPLRSHRWCRAVGTLVRPLLSQGYIQSYSPRYPLWCERSEAFLAEFEALPL